jgi:hypothetical protein
MFPNLISSLRGRGFSSDESEGVLKYRSPESLPDSVHPPVKPVYNPICPDCGSKATVAYRCAAAMSCTHGPGFHVECSACKKKFFQPE